MTPGQAASYKATRAELDGDPTALANLARKRRDAEVRAHRVLGLLMQRVPAGIRVGVWAVTNHHAVDVMLGGHTLTGHEVRANVMMLAEQFGLDYFATQHTETRDTVMVAAAGLYEGVPVKFWYLVAPCACENCVVSL